MSVLGLRNFIIGVLATLTMDVLAVLTIKLRLIVPLPPPLIGRWFASVARGEVAHADIAQVPPINRELAIAVPIH